MALTLQKQTSINVGVVVSNAVSSVKAVRASGQAQKESAFQQAVADGLDYAGQVAFREKQLKEEEASGFVDQAYIDKLKESLTSTKRLKRFYDYRTKYQEALGELNAGHTNAIQYADTLQKLFDDSSDPDLRAEIQTNLTAAQSKAVEYKQAALTNQVKLAQFDGTEKEINNVLKKVKTAKAEAQIAGNDDEVAAYELTIASLESQKVQTRAENVVNDIAVKGMLGTSNASSKLQTLNLQIAESDTTTPVTIDGKRYDSEQQYWELTRGSYLSGAGGGVFADYFSDLETQYKQKIDGETARYGFVQPSTIQRINTELTNLRSKPEMAPYIERIDSFRAVAVSDAVSTVAKTVIDRAEYTGDFLKADDTLKGLQTTYNVDTTGYQLQLGTILNGQINAAISAGESVPQDVLGALPAEQFPTPKVDTSIAPTEPTKTPLPEQTVTQKPDYEVKSGDNLSSVAARNGITLNRLLELNPEYRTNPNQVQIGAKLKLSEPIQSAPAPVQTPVASPVSPTPQPKPAVQQVDRPKVKSSLDGKQQVSASQTKQVEEAAKQVRKLQAQVAAMTARNGGGNVNK